METDVDFGLDDVNCQEGDMRLIDCPRRREGHNCRFYERAGVICQGKTKILLFGALTLYFILQLLNVNTDKVQCKHCI